MKKYYLIFVIQFLALLLPTLILGKCYPDSISTKDPKTIVKHITNEIIEDLKNSNISFYEAKLCLNEAIAFSHNEGYSYGLI